MCPRKTPHPSRAVQRLKEYLDIFDLAHAKHGRTLRYDIYQRAGTQWQSDRMIEYLEENGLIKGDKTNGYHKTEKGET